MEFGQLGPVTNVPQEAVHKGGLSGVHSANHIDPSGVLCRSRATHQDFACHLALLVTYTAVY